MNKNRPVLTFRMSAGAGALFVFGLILGWWLLLDKAPPGLLLSGDLSELSRWQMAAPVVYLGLPVFSLYCLRVWLNGLVVAAFFEQHVELMSLIRKQVIEWQQIHSLEVKVNSVDVVQKLVFRRADGEHTAYYPSSTGVHLSDVRGTLPTHVSLVVHDSTGEVDA